MRIGIYGGTFNPIHYGHLVNAEHVWETYFLDKIIFIPARQPVHKTPDACVPPEHRYRMLCLAADGNPCVEVSRIEIDRNEPSFTIYTVREIASRYPQAELFLITGSDAFNEIGTWKEFNALIGIVSFIVIARPGHDSDPRMLKFFGIGVPDAIRHPSEFSYDRKKIVFAKNPLMEISSSCIREKLKKKQTVRYLLPDSVIRYIIEKGLYTN